MIMKDKKSRKIKDRKSKIWTEIDPENKNIQFYKVITDHRINLILHKLEKFMEKFMMKCLKAITGKQDELK